MRPLNATCLIVALSLMAAPAFARPGAPPAKAHAAEAAKTKQDRDARIVDALKRQGIDEVRAKKVVAVIKKYRGEKQPVHEDVKKHAQALRELQKTSSNDQEAYARELQAIKDGRKKLGEIQDKQVSEIQTILKPSEQAKVLRLLQRGKAKHAGHHGKKKSA